MRITLNLATRPYADQGPAVKQLRIGMAALAVILAGLGLGMLHFHQAALRIVAQEDALDQSIDKIESEQRGYQVQMQQPANARVLTQAQFLNSLFDEKSFSWTAAMEDLERVLPSGEQVTAIEPIRGKTGQLTLRLRVSGPRERSVEMVRNMEHSRRFLSPRVTGENAENSSAQGDLQPVSAASKVTFEVLAEYNPATLDERQEEIAAQKRKHVGNAVTSAPAIAKPPASGLRGQYVPPNPQPAIRLPRSAVYHPGMYPGTNPAANQRPTLGARPYTGGDPANPTGIDPNGLKNHDRNRIPNPPVNSETPQDNQP